jgi:hypothetical protein
MSNERMGAGALIAGTLAMIGLMALHPSGIHRGPGADAMLHLGLIVHGVAIATAPVMTFGFFVLTRRIGFDNGFAVLGFFSYVFGAFAVMVAATMSGLVAPQLIQADASHDLLRFGWYLNQAFATLHVALFSAAILLYALGWPGKGVLTAVVQVVGFVVGVGILAWLFSGTLKLDVHGMGAVVLAQGIWFILAAIALLRLPART